MDEILDSQKGERNGIITITIVTIIIITIVIIIIIFVILQKREDKALSWQTRAVRRQMKANCYKPEVWDWKGKFPFLQKRKKRFWLEGCFPPKNCSKTQVWHWKFLSLAKKKMENKMSYRFAQFYFYFFATIPKLAEKKDFLLQRIYKEGWSLPAIVLQKSFSAPKCLCSRR